MNALRWIFGITISLIISVIGVSIIEFILRLFLIIFGGVGKTTWVELPTDFGRHLSFFNNGLLPLCLSAVISYAIGGYCCGKIIPWGNENRIKWICGIVIVITNVISCIFVWNGAHWFYSLIWVMTMILAGFAYVAMAEVGNTNK